MKHKTVDKRRGKSTTIQQQKSTAKEKRRKKYIYGFLFNL